MGETLLQFTAPRTRIFFRRRTGLRHALVTTAAACAVYACLVALSPEDTTVSPDHLAAVTLPAENTIATASDRAAPHDSLKEAFAAHPAEPGYTFAAAKPPLPPQEKKITTHLAKIQSGISSLLEAGTELLVSEKKVAVGKGDTLMEILVKNDVPRAEAHEAIAALSKFYDPRDLNPGHEITVFFHKDPAIADPKFSGLAIEKDMISTVKVNRGGDGSYVAGQEDKQVQSELRGFKGTIDSSLYVSAKAQGVPDGIILDLIKMYSWGVDFQREIQSGDRFEVMYEAQVTEDGKTVPGGSEIVFARLTLSGQDLPLYKFEDAAGDVDYFDQTGQSAKKPLMKTPIDGARLSSGFGMRRHPVLGYNKMHKGLDFAAPTGTPIYAAGDGTIEKLGRFSSYGNYIKIRHRGDIRTAYAHMKGFKSGLKSGARVKQGQVIGYVGTTGRSTGPHLHYEVMVAGRQVNPASIKLPTGKALKGKDLSNFKSTVASLDRQFAKVGRENTAIAAATPAASGTSRN